MALQSSASSSDPICLNEIKTEFSLIDSNCLKGFYKPHSESSVPASGTICLTDFLGESQLSTFNIDSVIFNTRIPSTSPTNITNAHHTISSNIYGQIYDFEYEESSSTTSEHTVTVIHCHGGDGSGRTNQLAGEYPYWVQFSPYTGDYPDYNYTNNGYFTDSARWSSSEDYAYITKVTYTFNGIYYGDNFVCESIKPSGGWGTDDTSWIFSSTGGLDDAGTHTHVFQVTGANMHLGYDGDEYPAGSCGGRSDRLYLTDMVITYAPH